MPSVQPYTPNPFPVPPDQRELINRGILNLIRAGKQPDMQKVFAGFTGRGGLHGLEYRSFASRYAYAEAKRTIEQGQFFTPDAVVAVIAEYLDVPAKESVADLCCGAGAFANHFRHQAFFGLEIDQDAATVAEYLFPEARIVAGDVRAWQPDIRARFCVGNPPFALRWLVPTCPMANALGEAASEDVFLWKVASTLAAGGTACFVAPASWLTDDLISAKAFAFVQSRFERVAEVLLPGDAFAAAGVPDFATKIVLLRTWLPHETPRPSTPVVIDGRGLRGGALVAAWRDATPGYFRFRQELGGHRAVLTLQDQRAARQARGSDVTMYYRFLRLHAELARKRCDAAARIMHEWEDSQRPVSYDKNGDVVATIRPDTVMRHVREELRGIDHKEQDAIRIVRTKRGIAVKVTGETARVFARGADFAFSNAEIATGECTSAVLGAAADRLRARLKSLNAPATCSLQTLNVTRVMRRLRRRFVLWERPLSEDWDGLETLKESCRAYYRRHASKGVQVREPQIDALSRAAAKPGWFCTWEMGCGKSLAALAWDNVKREEDASVHRRSGWTLVVSSALGLELHWRGQMEEYGLRWTQPKTREAWEALSRTALTGAAFVLASHYHLQQCPRLVRSLVRRGVITALVVDEADEFGNGASLRARALAVAGREIRHKALFTGTPARNNGVELYSQLSVLLHGEPFFRCLAPRQVVYDHGMRDFTTIPNPEYLQPYGRRGGLALWRRCHAPARPTVMGAERDVPQLPNWPELERFLGCFRSRLRLRTLQGRDPYIRTTTVVTLARGEREAYDHLARHAVEIARNYLAGERSERRASLLSLAHAIMLMQQAVSQPSRFGFVGQGAKEAAVVEAIRASSATHVAVGVTWRDTVANLLPVLQREFPNRDIVAFDGEDSFRQRQRKLAQLTDAPRGILLCTRGSIRSSLNLPIVGEVIAESFPWNFTSLNQFVMRFCRLTSRAVVPVRLLVAGDTIEERILGLLLRKEQVAAPLAGDNCDSEAALMSEYGIPAADLDELAKYLTQHDPSLRDAATTRAA